MAQHDQEAPMTTEEMLAAVGIVVTPEGKARARAKLDAARAAWPPERFEKLRRELGLRSHDR
jgi:uncharacterized membrane protein